MELNDIDLHSILKQAKDALAPDSRLCVFDVRGTINSKNECELAGEIHSLQLKYDLFHYLNSVVHLPLIDSIEVLPQKLLSDKTYGIISISVANCHITPNLSSTVGTQVLSGTPVQVLKKQDEWYFVQLPDNYLGWISETVSIMNLTEYNDWVRRPKVIIINDTCKAYSDTAMTEPASDLVIGDIVALCQELGHYQQIQFSDNRSAFISTRCSSPLDQWINGANCTRETTVKTAKTFMGIPYLWGALSSKALDCSGFVKLTYFLNGVLLPRDSDQQAQLGDPVSEDSMQPGDLLFFGTKESPKQREKITHVALSLGGSRYIHASGYVRVNSLNPKDTEYYSERRVKSFLFAKRIIGTVQGNNYLRNIPYYKGVVA